MRSVAGREIGREGNFEGCTLMRTLTNIQTVHIAQSYTHNAALDLEALVLVLKNSEHV